MHYDPDRIIERARRILTEKIQPAIEVASTPLTVTARPLPGEPEPFASAVDGEFASVAIGHAWGPAWTTTWFHVCGLVPAEWLASADAGAIAGIAAAIDIGFAPDSGPGFQCEGLAFDTSGHIIKGIHPRSQLVPIAGPEIDLYVEAAANPDIAAECFHPTHLGDGIDPGGTPLYRLQRADAVLLDPEIQQLAYDIDVLLGWAEQLPADRPRRGRILTALAKACDALDLADIGASTPAARAILAPALASPAEPSAHRVAAIGHAHIDSAWLWPQRETVRKCTRTFANVLALMDRYPELRFACSQAQQYAWIEGAHPDLFARITEAVRAGRWIPAGGMWVESDTNMPGGEALARQFIHGKRYFEEKFGFEPREVWLPDSFGYTAALPQIATLAGYRWFLTQKLAWHPTNPFPHHTFWWQGIDGTRIFSHLPPVDTYLSELSAAELDHAASNFRDHPGASMSAVPFGHGDGGGGPTELMMERAARQANLEGSPRIHHATPTEFFTAAEADYPDAPTWVGELYMEAHRGTYTSQAATKRGNRRSEHLLREAELWCATATIRCGVDYPYADLDRLWKTVLLHQFHDILPGSSIAWVHRQAAETYRQVAAELESLIDRALDTLTGTGTTPLAFNAAPVAADGVPALGAGIPARQTSPVEAVPPIARTDPEAKPRTNSQVADLEVCEEATSARSAMAVLDNGYLRLQFDASGAIVSAIDLGRDRELVAPGGKLNQLVLHQDLPNAFDAWDVDEHYRGSFQLLDATQDHTLEHHPDGSVSLVVTRRFGSSSATQRTTLRPGAREIDFDIEVDWHERERFLKAAFPLDVHADTSTSEIQFGHIRRPTHANTTWDSVKFEICAHRWVHVGEPGFGVAIANDSTYGHDIRRREDPAGGRPGTEIRLSLLRGPRYPDPDTDQGRHHMRYRLVSGADIADAVDAGYRLNLPPRERQGAQPVAPLVRVSPADDAPTTPHGVIVESVKLAEDRSGDLIVRLYESLGARTRVRIDWDLPTPARAAAIVDLLERELEPLPDTSHATVALRPFQIVTLRIHRRDSLEDERESNE